MVLFFFVLKPVTESEVERRSEYGESSVGMYDLQLIYAFYAGDDFYEAG